ncbi:MAG TPA: c(7)-type cytochrome triheme domain-containing protein [Longimicrobiales bacterium]|nr:c(7)-type cytochrome triheme domain-containing protein [Longimicrobiales bacterium]
MIRAWPGLVFPLVLVTGLTGCMAAAKVFLDIPESTGPERSAEFPPELLEQLALKPPPLPPPAIEGVTDPDSVLGLLPTDHSGGVDWVRALRSGVIRPRAVAAGLEEAGDSAGEFSYDLYLSDGTGPEAYFPHSAHKDWLDCRSCHPRVYRGGKSSLDRRTVHESSSCGYCHGPVAFPIQACERCHETAADLPPGRLPKTLGETIQMVRGEGGDSINARGAFRGMELGGAYPPATFPHGQHRLRFRCRACHEDPFPMVRGATILSQEDAHSKRGCGRCHEGSVAFDIALDACGQCHIRAAQGDG